MRVLITAGPTRQYIDTVRFITNASSGHMGCSVARAAVQAGHDVTLLLGPVSLEAPGGCEVVRFVTVEDLKRELQSRFDSCDVLVMVAAVGDFQVEKIAEQKLPRSGGPIELRFVPTEDILAGVAANKRDDQIVIAFAVEDGDPQQIEAKARSEMAAKNADYVVVNTPEAIEQEASNACILSADKLCLPWQMRPKNELAEAIMAILNKAGE